MTGKYRIVLSGGLVGPIWWPAGVECCKPVTIDLRDLASRMDNPTMRELLLYVTQRHGGDFQGCDFTEDTTIVVSREVMTAQHLTVRARYWPITAFKSVADMVKVGAISDDYN